MFPRLTTNNKRQTDSDMKKLILASMLICLPMLMMGQADQARMIAANFFNQHNEEKGIVIGPNDFVMVDSIPYVFNLVGGKGFVVVSPDATDERGIMAYSYESDIDPFNPAVSEWLSLYRHCDPTATKRSGSKSTVASMITSHWDQRPYYNALCPIDAETGEQVSAGSVVTSMAQVMHYFKHPLVGQGSSSYDCPSFGILSAQFDNTIYRWNQMPDSLDANSSANEVQSIAKLIYHCGIATQTIFNTDANGGSATYPISYGVESIVSVESALKTNFKYKNSVQGVLRSRYDDVSWEEMIANELESGRPVIYTSRHEHTATGRTFICDGHDGQGYFHFNWGCNGESDGYFSLGNLNPTLDSFAYNFISSQNIIIGIEPDHSISDDTSGVGIRQTERPATLIYPNPTTGKINILTDEGLEEVAVFDPIGRTVLRQGETGSHQIDLEALPQGAYLLRLTYPDRVENRKIVKQ